MECCIYLHEKVSFLIINQVQTGFEKNSSVRNREAIGNMRTTLLTATALLMLVGTGG